MSALFRLAFSFLVILPALVFSNIRIPSILADNMVLQRNTMTILWGWADPKERINISTGWNHALYSVCADEDGSWLINVQTGDAGGPYTIILKGRNEIKLKNIMLGEVWLCSGQSNMEYSLNDLGAANFNDTRSQIATSDLHGIRLCKILQQASAAPLDSCQAKWSEITPETAFDFSATALFFGLDLYKNLNIPIGLINASWGGTPAESWTSMKAIENEPDLNFYLKSPNSTSSEQCKVSVLYNGMVHPIVAYAIKGVIWYQGEANRWDADLYGKLFQTMITDWRSGWNRGNFPFYFVQIAPYNYGQEDAHELSGYLREAQTSALKLPNTGMISTLDIGELNNIHPKNKQEVGRRLATLALKNTYNINVAPVTGPSYTGMEKLGDKIKINFDSTIIGRSSTSNKCLLSGFRIAGPDNIFKIAKAEIVKSSVLVSNDEIRNPVSVRYAFEDTDTASLVNTQGLPAFQFRTDSLRFFYRKIGITVTPDSLGKTKWVNFTCNDPKAEIYFTLDGSIPTLNSELFIRKVRVNSIVHIVAKAFKKGATSPVISELRFISNLAMNKKIKLRHAYAEQYSAEPNALINGLLGSTEFREGNWQGFYGTDLIAKIKLDNPQEVHTISAEFLEDQTSWIFLPNEVEFQVSSNGIFWHRLNVMKIDATTQKSKKSIYRYATKNESKNIRYIRVIAKSVKKCPDWHPGAGKTAWLFADEIIAE